MKLRLFFVLCLGLLGMSLVTAQTPNVEADYVGRIDNSTPFREYALRVPITGSTVTIDMRPLEGEAGGDLDTLLYLVDENGSIVGENDDRVTNQDSSSLLIYPQAVAGQYRIIATRFKIDKGNTGGDFRILIDIQQPSPTASFGTRLGDLLNTGFPIDFEPREQASWTVLVYYGGDNNLEPGIIQDFKEFELGGGSDDTVRVLAMVDRTAAPYSVADGDWSNTRIYEVAASINDEGQLVIDETSETQRDDGVFLASTPLVEFDPLNTADGEILAQFLVWGVTNFPADNYIVAIGSHGAGWGGIVTDDTAQLEGDSKNILTLPELDKAFALALQATGGKKFALLINDACLMGSVEYFATIAPYFDYTIASPEIVVNPALDMTLLLNGLRGAPDSVDIVELSKLLIDKYINEDVPKRQTTDIVYMTNALISLDDFSMVVSAIENFAQVVNRNPNVRGLTVGEARSNVYVYTSFMGGKDSVDIGDLMRRVISNARDDEMIAAAETVLNALETAYLYGQSGERATRFTSYFNVYFPERSADFKFAYFDETPLKGWSRMLRSYFNSFTPKIWTGGAGEITFHTPISPDVKITYSTEKETNILQLPQINVEVRGRNISDGRATFDRVINEETVIRVGIEPILTPITVEGEVERVNRWEEGIEQYFISWDAKLPVVSDGINRSVELVNVTERVAFLDGLYREPESDVWNEVSVAFDLAGRRGGVSTVQRVVNRGQNTSAVAVVEIPVGSEFQTYQNIVTPDGRVAVEPGNIYVWPQGGLTWQSLPAPSGVYNIGLQVSAFGGSLGNAEAQIVVNNDGISALLSGYSDPFLGFNVPLPSTWETLTFDDNLTLYRSKSVDQRQNLSVYLDLYGGTDPASAIIGITEFYGLTVVGEPTPITIAERDALELAYTYVANGTNFTGRMFILMQDGLGLGFAAETSGEDNEEFFRTVQSLISFTDPNEARTQARTAWQRGKLGDNVEFYVPNTWARSETEDGWVMFKPTTEESGALIGTRVVEITTTVQGVDSVVNNLVTGLVTQNADSAVITGNQIYYFEASRDLEPVPYSLDWRATIYEGVRDGIEVIGRVYATQQDGKTYAIWVEAPKGELAASIFPTIFEPMVESYRIYPVTDSE